MLTADGCKARRARLLGRIKPAEPLLLGDPLNLRYLAGFTSDPFSLGADYAGLLEIQPDGTARFYYDARVPKSSVEEAHADEKIGIPWYDGKSPGQGPRRMILRAIADQHGGRIHDCLSDALAPSIFNALHELRRAKNPDELDTIKACCRAGEAGQAWARGGVKAGMTELDVFNAIQVAVNEAAGKPVILYGDFAVTPGSAKRGGAPTSHVLRDGETLILDFSVVIAGYRSDYTNTLVVGVEPTTEQHRLFDLCLQAMRAGEAALKPGATGQAVYRAVQGVFEAVGMASAFPHHAGHGIGIAHPEAPFLVPLSTETLLIGDVVTLEPGLYVDGVGGVRIEHNYLITPTGFETLAHHELRIDQ